MSQPVHYTLELQDCASYYLASQLDKVILMYRDPYAAAQQWMINSVFEPGVGLAGFVIANVATSKALKFMGPNMPLEMSAEGAPVEVGVLWQLVSPVNANLWHITAYADPGQAVDAVGTDGCKNGAVIQSHRSGQTNRRQLWRVWPSPTPTSLEGTAETATTTPAVQ
jgi:hypothetical protein